MPATLLFILSLFINADEPADLDIWGPVNLAPVSSIELSASALPGKWKVIQGLRIDNLAELEDVADPQRQTVESLAKQLLPLGIKSTADFSVSAINLPLNTVTVRVFIFEDAELCQQWWKKKYQYAGWQKHYQQVEQAGMIRVDSLQMNKSALAFSHVWLTTHQLQDGTEHIDAANHIIRLLTNGKKGL